MHHRLTLTSIVALIACASSTSVAAAQDSAPSTSATDGAASPLGEIVVTAQRRKESMQRVGIAMSAVSGEELARANISSPAQLPQFSSGVQLAQPNGDGSFSFSVRGVTQNDYADHEESPTAIYIDGAYVSQMSGLAFQIFDLDRVEILRGPQGTLFGRNATGGLAQFISRAPTEQFDGYLQLGYGRFNDVKVEGAIGGPLTASGAVRGRLSFATDDHDPIFDNRAGGPRLENGHSRAVRGQLLFDMGGPQLLLIGRYGKLDVDAGAWETRTAVPIPDGPQAGYGEFAGGLNALGYPSTGKFTTFDGTKGYAYVKTYEGSAKLDVPLGGGGEWSTLVDYQHLDKAYHEDSDGSPDELFEAINGNTVEQVSVDSHASGDVGALHWIGGLYYLHITGSYFQGATGSIYGGLDGRYHLTTTSYAAFAQLEYAIDDKFKVIGGLRYTKDKKQFAFTQSYPGFFYRFDASTVGDLAHSDTGFWTGKAELDYQANPSTLLYASFNVGVKAGGFNAPFDVGLNPDDTKIPFKNEKLIDYELGLKNELFDRRLRVNLSAFYYDYRNYQALQFINLTQLVSNTPAEYYGGEIELRYVPSAAWTLGATLSYSHGTVKNIDLNGTGPRDYLPANAPRWSGNAMIQHRDTIGSGALTEQIDGNFVSKQYFALTNAPDTGQGAYGLLNARLNYTTGDKKWDLGVAVENLTDTHYTTMAFDLAGFLGFAQRFPGRPRWWSVNAAYHF
jgi:iron complex outermembrane recepter protein